MLYKQAVGQSTNKFIIAGSLKTAEEGVRKNRYKHGLGLVERFLIWDVVSRFAVDVVKG